MAIVACKECARKVSDKAAWCPHCGVSIAGVVQPKPRRVKPWLYGTLVAGLLAWGALTTLWLMGTIPVPKQLVGFIGTSSSPIRTTKAPEKKVERVSLVATAQSALEPQPVNSAVYRTSAEQLYQDYDANEVAIQSKIGGSPIRLSGSIAEINEDASGHPVVTLHAGSGNRADMLLTDDQRSAAAQLSKEDAVEIQCNKMQRIAARLHGSGCALVLVDAGTVYLAVSLSGKAGDSGHTDRASVEIRLHHTGRRNAQGCGDRSLERHPDPRGGAGRYGGDRYLAAINPGDRSGAAGFGCAGAEGPARSCFQRGCGQPS